RMCARAWPPGARSGHRPSRGADRAAMQRRLAAIVHADLAGFTRLMEGAETRTFRHLKSAQTEVWRPAIDAGGGRLVGTAGDAMLAEFGSAVAAVRAAIDTHQRTARVHQ